MKMLQRAHSPQLAAGSFNCCRETTKIGHRLPARVEGRFNYHDQQGSKKHGGRFVCFDDYFYGLGLLVKYDKKP